MESTDQECAVETRVAEKWPLEIRCVLESLSRPVRVEQERRRGRRTPCRLRAKIWLPEDTLRTAPAQAYLRDYSERGVGFVTTACLKVDTPVELELEDGTGNPQRVHCTVARSRQFSEGWFEGALMAARKH